MDFLLRFGAVSGVVCGVLIGIPGGVEAVTGETTVTSFLIGFSAAFGIPLVTAVHLAMRGVGGRLGDIGYAVNVIGLALFGAAGFALNLVVFFLDDATRTEVLAGPTRFALLLCALVFVTGSWLFAAGMLRSRLYPRVLAWGYALSLTLFAVAARLPDSVLGAALHVAVGATLGWLAVLVWKQASLSRSQPAF